MYAVDDGIVWAELDSLRRPSSASTLKNSKDGQVITTEAMRLEKVEKERKERKYGAQNVFWKDICSTLGRHICYNELV